MEYQQVRCPVSKHVLCWLKAPVAGPELRFVCRCKRVVLCRLQDGSFSTEIEPQPTHV